MDTLKSEEFNTIENIKTENENQKDPNEFTFNNEKFIDYKGYNDS